MMSQQASPSSRAHKNICKLQFFLFIHDRRRRLISFAVDKWDGGLETGETEPLLA